MQKVSARTEPWNQYALDVISGEIPANNLVRLACQRHLHDLDEADSRGLYFDNDAAWRVIEFFSFLHHSKGEWAGQPFVLDGWQTFIIACVYGWKRKIDGTRRFRTIYVAVPRKNGKSTLLAGVGLYQLVGDEEPGAEVYTFATKKDQAKIIFSEAERMHKSSPALQKRVGSFRNNLHVVPTNSKFEPLSSEDQTLDGLNTSCGLGDELHAHPNRYLWDVIATSTGARRQPLMWGITTAGVGRESFCFSQHDYAEKILNGIIRDDSFFAFVAMLDEGADWESELEWQKANPNYGKSVKVDKLREEALQAKQQPTSLNTFLRYRLNVWVQATERAIAPDKWRACAGVVNVDAAEMLARWKALLLGKACYGGLDLANTLDIGATVFFFPKQQGVDTPLVLPFFFCPEEAIHIRARRDRVPYETWAAQGFIFPTPGEVIDYPFIRTFLRQFTDDYRVIEIGYDRWNSTQLVTQLHEEDSIEMVQVGQGFQGMSASTKEMLKMVAGGQFHHGGNPVLSWMADNLMVSSDPAGNIKPDKAKSREKIDGMVALSMAIGRSMSQPDVPSDDAPVIWRV